MKRRHRYISKSTMKIMQHKDGLVLCYRCQYAAAIRLILAFASEALIVPVVRGRVFF